MLGLPDHIRACLFDLDGVLTQTAKVHAAAWKAMFDDFLRSEAERTGTEFVPFDQTTEYDRYVDGRPRLDGTRTFLASRGIELPEGAPDDAPGTRSINGLSTTKNELVLRLIREQGVQPYQGSVDYLDRLAAAGVPRAVVSSSANCRDVLKAAGIDGYFDTVIDGVVATREGLPGKPAPDTYLAAARELGVEPGAAAVFEDALAGVASGRAGGFGCVVGVNRTGQAEALRENGADLVVDDLNELIEGAAK
ncbi:HAD family hydrolase [Kitasatospora viridis]|uniref:Beta-phosphoglucomutase n=1 Tax=Kitasatospora viridis TaxID=281105 RepID=A0A561UGR0_9ACTN|nr:beta-phosphoglucomutase family hydrolase [Kitasatospora viridis]TWF98544.1 HAD superfamily hydrolase (TIGR01509 family)/beta-phosphoglucomutase family hydrolase [Kitasatospora viridis]